MAPEADTAPYTVDVDFEPTGDQSSDNETAKVEETVQVLSQHVGNTTGSVTGTYICAQSIRNARIHVNLHTSQHGNFWQPNGDPSPASIIVFRLTCDTKDSKTRFESLVVKLELESMNSRLKPIIYKYSPAHIIGESTRTKQAFEISSKINIGGTFTPASFDFGLSRGLSSEQYSRFELKAVPTGSAVTGGTHGIAWVLKENSATKSGIPAENDFALLIGNQGNFTVRLSLKARLSPSFHPTSWIGMRSRRTATIPILLRKPIGTVMDSTLLIDMDKIELSDHVALPEC
ncbi:hypothetical protein ABW19_dt0206515 [Dactylella cylindrospora]|nr:hypothetical protein ABW19_dt0206515 [Dactylella cylindrospora]